MQAGGLGPRRRRRRCWIGSRTGAANARFRLGWPSQFGSLRRMSVGSVRLKALSAQPFPGPLAQERPRTPRLADQGTAPAQARPSPCRCRYRWNCPEAGGVRGDRSCPRAPPRPAIQRPQLVLRCLESFPLFGVEPGACPVDVEAQHGHRRAKGVRPATLAALGGSLAPTARCEGNPIGWI